MNQLLKNQTLRLIIRQVITSVGFGLIGLMISAIAVRWFVDELGDRDERIYLIMTVYLGMFLGICFGGYTFLKTVGRQRECVRFIIQGVFGLAIGLVISWKLFVADQLFFPRTLGHLIVVIAPLAGLILGFNYNLVHQKKKDRYKE